MLWKALALGAGIWLAGCAREAPPAPVTSGADVRTITALQQQLNVAVSARDLDAVMALYGQSAAMIGPNGLWLDRADIQRYYLAMADDPNARFETEPPIVVEVAAGEGLGYSSGEYREVHTDAAPGRVRITTGRTLRVWKREGDAWRITLESRTPHEVRLD